MYLTELQIRNLRCLGSVHIQPGPGLNFIVGDNGEGKTSLLEAIHILSRARSFRSNSGQKVIKDGETELTVFGRVAREQQPGYSMGVQRRKGELEFKLSNSPAPRILDMLRALPVQVISPDLHSLLERGPGQRRRFLDWGVFHVEPEFHAIWQRYHRALLQRNSALRSKQPESQVTAWNTELVVTGQRMDTLRSKHVEALREKLAVLLQQHPGLQADLEYQRGWAADIELSDLLLSNIQRDRQRGYTVAGPHRADIRLLWQGKQAAETASRGEQKLLISMLHLIQAMMVGEETGARPILLIDDMAAELGRDYREQFIAAVAASGLQAFLSFLEAAQIPEEEAQGVMFHVKHGQVL